MSAMMNPSKPTLVTVCGDPGGASAVAPVLKLLAIQDRVRIKPVAYNEATVIWSELGIPYTKIPSDFSLEATLELLREPNVEMLFTGTSVNGIDLEKQFIAAGRQIGLPSLSLIDFWTNYTWRFGNIDGGLTYLPDKIAVMDTFAFDEMVLEGFEAARLVITGQPAFDDLTEWRASFSPQRRIEIREALGVKPDELFVLFTSQPLTSLYGTDVIHEKYLGFDEWTVLDTLLVTLEGIKGDTDAKIHLVVRPHPRENEAMFRGYHSEIFPVTVVKEGTARSQVMAADLVVGMNTELLVEACYLGCITLSLQPGLRHPDRLPTNRLGVSRAVYRQEDIRPALQELLLSTEARAEMSAKVEKFKIKNKSAENVANLIYEMIAIDQKE